MSDKRLRDFIKHKITDGTPAVQIIPFPSDEGVKRNGGRPGAAQAPGQIIDQLLNLTPHPTYFERHTKLLSTVSVMDPVSCSGNVEEDQELLGRIVGKALEKHSVPVIIGGGHETSYGHFLGYVYSALPVSILNIDAHTDVRNLKDGKAHSGSPFRQAVEHSSGLCSSYNVFGLNPSSVAIEHRNFVLNHGKILFDTDLNRQTVQKFLGENSERNILATMDMDAVNQGDAPGVSAPNSSGISAAVWLNSAYELGKHPSVLSFDLCEVNPLFDRDTQTVKLAARTVWNFLLGLSFR